MSSRISIPHTARPAKCICCQCFEFHHIPFIPSKTKSYLENNGETIAFEPPTGCGHTGCGGCIQYNSDGNILHSHESEAPNTWRCGNCNDTSIVLDALIDRVQCCEFPVVDIVYDHLGQVLLGKAEEKAEGREIHSVEGLTQFQHWLYGVGAWVYLENVDEVMGTPSMRTNKDPGAKRAQKVEETGARRQNDGIPSTSCDDLPYWHPEQTLCQEPDNYEHSPSLQDSPEPTLPSDSLDVSSTDSEDKDVAATPPRPITATAPAVRDTSALIPEKRLRKRERKRQRVMDLIERAKAKSAEESAAKFGPASSTAIWTLPEVEENALERARWSLPPRKTAPRVWEATVAASTKDPLEYSGQKRAPTGHDTANQTTATQPYKHKRVGVSDFYRPSHHGAERYRPTTAPTNKRRTTLPPFPYGRAAQPRYDGEPQQQEFRGTKQDDAPLHWRGGQSYGSRDSYRPRAPPRPRPPLPHGATYVQSWEEMGASMSWAPMPPRRGWMGY